jgi:uncharacterized protein (DUF1330 family)
MSVYVIFSYDIADQDSYAGYVPAVIPLLEKHHAEILVADYAVRALEGEARGVNVVLRFPSEEAAMAMYNDPAYQPVKKVRIGSTTAATAVLAKEFTVPGR